ncbi:MAG: peptidylprolyl isomerase [Alphaproteobacteria bacterium]|nr:peptidylprolyl isomerase [Alphaproteobacteria bacterium]
MSNISYFHKESGKTVAIVLVLVAAIALGVFAFLYSKKTGNGFSQLAQTAAPVEAANSAAEQPAAGEQQAAAPAAEDPAAKIKPGNPVVAKVDGKDVNRMDVLNFMQNLPPQTRQMPLDKLFPLALDQVINSQIIVEKTKGVNLDSDPEVQKQMAMAKEQITRAVFLQKEVEKQMNEQKLKDAYDTYVKNFPKVEEVKASHILVKEEAKAKELIEKLNGGADFAQLAKENSTDGTAAKGGELGYFAQAEVVPDFAKAAFATAPGSYTKEPVKTQFGYHIIKAEDKRQRPPATFEEAKPLLEAQVRRDILENIVKEWREKAKVETFDINGDKIEPSAGQ